MKHKKKPLVSKNRREETVEKLNEVIQRLTNENAHNRKRIEEAKNKVRLRAPNADGLSLPGAVDVILEDRDRSRKRIGLFRDELKKVLRLLAEGKSPKEVLAEINQFLFKNPLH